MRWLLVLFAGCLLSGCYYSASVSYSITVTTQAQPDTIIAGTSTTLVSIYQIDNASVYLTAQDWTVTTAPAAYVISDQGRDATFTPAGSGTFVVRYRAWYYTNWDYNYCYCTYATGYRESYVTVTVLPAPSG